MKYQVYPAYKESGVEWLGEVPAHCEGCSRQNKIDKVLRFLWIGEKLMERKYKLPKSSG